MEDSQVTDDQDPVVSPMSAMTTTAPSPSPPVLGISVLLLVILAGILGNILVCLAVTQFRTLRTVANFYVVSLAVADVLVCTAVMPLALYQEATGGMWYLPGPLCKIWGAMDIMLSSSSILHLCAISIDRFNAITKPIKYVAKRTAKMAFTRIAIVWMLSALVSIPAFFLFQKENDLCVPNDTTNVYAWCSSSISFYIPCVVILIVYFKIYNAAKRRARRVIHPGPVCTISANIRQHAAVSQSSFQDEGRSNQLSSPAIADRPDSVQSVEPVPPGVPVRDVVPVTAMLSTRAEAQSRISLARERKAARTIGIVVGAFIVCWLPFFILHSIFNPMCSSGHEGLSCEAVPTLYRIFTWVGWCNSSLNPIIYTVFNREFRQAFKKLLKCRKN
ncbi:octopamine receptor-like [Patiria miniata]|uniref:G-protein coupled receptors family 1 profile domain-containing protein n=1 Tax=Patiria miniata TaxID=46514 RepID=A0A914B434_PATMI|nr:octopamine receptor-like [Patiria miniata]